VSDDVEPRWWTSRAGVVLLLVVVLAWIYLAWMAWGMEHMDAGMILMPRMTAWQPIDLLLVWTMWGFMMAAMMLPSATPMLLSFAAITDRAGTAQPAAETITFAAGYVIVWGTFSATVTLLQWAALEARLITPGMEAGAPWVAGMLLVLAGVYQFTRWKLACLSLCRAPMRFLVKYWRSGTRGALVMGVRHGLYCLGCCWALMLSLFVLGVMNLFWIVALALLVMAEKTVPNAQWVVRLSGAGFIAWGIWLLARTVV
jgi:predicted metal-binding membrane protein